MDEAPLDTGCLSLLEPSSRLPNRGWLASYRSDLVSVGFLVRA